MSLPLLSMAPAYFEGLIPMSIVETEVTRVVTNCGGWGMPQRFPPPNHQIVRLVAAATAGSQAL